MLFEDDTICTALTLVRFKLLQQGLKFVFIVRTKIESVLNQQWQHYSKKIS